MAGYIRQSTFSDGDTITAALFNNEYDQLLNVFSNTSGHKHDGTAAEGPVIGLIGDAGLVTPLNKILIDTTNDHIEFWIDVSGTSTQQLYIADGAILPVTDNDIDLGSSSLEFKDLFIDGTANIDSLVADTADINGGTLDNVTIGATTAAAGTFTTVTTTSNVVVGGNLTVSGTTTTVNSNEVNIGDNIIVLNSDETGTPSQNGGIEIERGTSTNVSLLWNETNDYWTFGSNHLNFPDNSKAYFGDSNDLQIYHSSGNNFINAPVGGNLLLQANNITARSVAQEVMLNAAANGAVTLYYDNSAKLATTSAGIDVTGGQRIIGNSGDAGSLEIYDVDNGTASTDALRIVKSANEAYIFNRESSGGLNLGAGNTLNHVVITSAGNVGIGAASPSRQLTVQNSGNAIAAIVSGTSSLAQLALGDTDDDNYAQIILENSTNKLQIQNGGGGAVGNRGITLDSSENVGIGTESPSSILHLKDTVAQVKINSDDGQSAFLTFGDASDTTRGGLEYTSDDALVFETNNMQERMRIDSSGRLLIGGTSTSFNDILRVFGDGYAGAWRTGTSSTYVGKMHNNAGKLALETDGSRDIQFGNSTNTQVMYIDTSEQNVGIGTASPSEKLHVEGNALVTGNLTVNGNLTFGNAATDTVSFGADIDSNIIPDDDNTYDLGSSSQEWKDLYIDGVIYADQIDLGDNEKIRLGASQDLEIYHDGSHSYIKDAGTGNLKILADNLLLQRGDASQTYIQALTGGAVDLRYAGAAKLATTSTGIDVTGGIGISGSIPKISLTDSDVDRTAEIYANSDNLFLSADVNNAGADSNIQFHIDGAEKARLTSDGRLGIGTTSPNQKLVISEGDGETTLSIDNATTTTGNHARIFLNHNGILGARIQSENIEDFTTELKRTANLSFHTRNNGTQIEAVRIKEDGNVGIGTTSPTSLLEVSDTSGDVDFKLRSSNTGSSTIRMGDAGNISAGYIEYDNNVNNYIFATGNTERLRIDSSGNVGIGTTSPSSPLHVDSTSFTAATFERNAGVNSGVSVDLINSDGNKFNLASEGTEDFNIGYTPSGGSKTNLFTLNSSGNVGIGTTSPAEKLHVNSGTTDKVAIFESSDTTATIELKDPTASSQILNSVGMLILKADPSNASGSTRIGFETDGSERMRIDSSGNLLVGATSPKNTFAEKTLSVISSASNSQGMIEIGGNNTSDTFISGLSFTNEQSTDTSNFQRIAQIFAARDGNNNAGDLVFNVHDGSTLNRGMTIKSDGKIGIGTTSPSSPLHVKGGSTTTQSTFSNFISNSTFRSVVNHANEYGLYMGYANATTDTSAIQSGRSNGTTDELALNPYGGNVGIGTDSPTDKVEVYANGADVALKIHEDAGTHTARLHLREGTQDTYIQNRAGNGFEIRTENNISTSSTAAMQITAGGDITTGYNLTVGGNLTVSGTTTTIDTTNLNVEDKNITINYSTGDSSSTADGAGITIQDAVDASTDASLTWNATDDNFEISHGLDFGDNSKARFGAGNDLEIYHDGSNSYIRDSGTGNLRIAGQSVDILNPDANEFKARFLDNGAVNLYYDNALKLATTSSGIDVTGTVGADGLNLGTTGNATLANILSADNTSNTLISGGNATNAGANYALFGGSHASLANVHRWRVGGTEIARFDASGNLGIGTTSPLYKLHVQNSGNVALFGDGTRFFRVYTDADEVSLLADGSVPMKFFTSGAEKMRIDTSGNVGIGISSPSEKLHVQNGSSGFSGSYNARTQAIIESNNSTGTVLSIMAPNTGYSGIFLGDQDGEFSGQIHYDHPTNALRFATSGAEKMRIDSSGNVGIGNSTPTGKLHVYDSGTDTYGTQPIAIFDYYDTDDAALRYSARIGDGSTTFKTFVTGSLTDFLIVDQDNQSGRLAFQVQGNAGNIEALAVDSTGLVGIGTTSPSTNLEVKGGSGVNTTLRVSTDGTATPDPAIQLYRNSGAYGEVRYNPGGNIGGESGLVYTDYRDDTSSKHIWQTRGAEKMRLDSVGNLGIGTTAPSDTLHVAGIIRTHSSSTSKYIRVFGGNSGNFLDSYGNTLFIRPDGNSSNAVALDTAGNVGIGTTSPSSLLHLESASSPTLQLKDTTNNVTFKAYAQNSDAHLATTSNHDLIIDTNNTERMRIKSSGRVGIGTDSPTETLDVAGSAKFISVSPSYTDTNGTSSSTNYFKLGRIVLLGSQGAIITIMGTTSYSSGNNISGETKIYLRGNNSTSTLSGHFFGTTSGNTIVEAVAWKQTGTNNEFDIWIKYGGSFAGLEHYIETDGGWTQDVSDTGSTSAPTGSTALTSVFAVATAGNERMRIDSSGNVGIGTTSPAQLLHLASTNPNIRLEDTDGANKYGQIRFNGTSFDIMSRDSGNAAIRFGGHGSSNFTEYARFNNAGNLGIGTTSPTRLLDIQKTTIGDIASFRGSDGARELVITSSTTTSTGDTYTLNANSSNGVVAIATNSSERLRITNAGNVGIGTTSPSSKLSVHGGSSGTDTDVFSVFSQSGAFNVRCSDLSAANPTWTLRTFSGEPIAFAIATTEAMRIQSGGTVNIGVNDTSSSALASLLNLKSDTDTDAILRVVAPSSATTELRLQNLDTSSNGIIKFGDAVDNDVGFIEYDHGSNYLRFGTNAGERARIDSSGNFLVGMSSYSTTSAGHYITPAGAIFSQADDARVATFSRFTSDGEIVRFRKNSTTVGNISVTGSATAYNTSSDARLKDITGSARGLAVINELNPVAYDWKADGKSDEGLIAQEVKELVPNAVSGSEEDMYQMDYSKLVVHLVKGMQEQQQQIESLKSEIQLLKGGN